MYVDGIVCFKCQILTSLCLMFLLAQFILIVDSAKPGNPSIKRQMCSKLQSMLSYGRYQTTQIPSNITYIPRFYAQNFLAYSTIDDLLILIEPKHQINVYNAQTIQPLVNLSTTDVVIAISTTSLISDSHHDLFFLYETNSITNLISLRVCQVRFNMLKLIFEDNHCIETITLQYDQPNLRINGFTIKRDHAGTKKSLLFISTDVGLIYTIFDTRTGSVFGESTILNETLNEGSIVLSSSGSIYYASKQEHLIYELHISREFRLRYGKIIKTNAIKYPFGLITDECNHLYIATRSMILVMYVQTRSTIRSVFSKASDLPITLERLNSTTYVYTTIRKHSGRTTPYWMFNFLYFTDPERSAIATRHPVVNLEEKLDFNGTTTNSASIARLWPVSYPLSTNGTKKYITFSSASRKSSSRFRKKTSKQTRTTIPVDREKLSIDKNKLFTPDPSMEQSITDLSGDFQSIDPDENLEIEDNLQIDYQEQINQLVDNEVQSETQLPKDTSSDPYSFLSNSSESVISIDDLQNDSIRKENLTLNQPSRSTTSFIEPLSDSHVISKYLNSTFISSPNQTIGLPGTLFSEDDIRSYLEGRANLTSIQQAQIKASLANQSSSDYNIFSKYPKITDNPSELVRSDDNLPTDVQRNKDTSTKENIQSRDYQPKRPLFDLKLLNRTIDIGGTLFSEADVQSYLEGRRNLTSSPQEQIQAYLANQSSSDYNIFSTYSQTTNKPSGILTSDGTVLSEIEIEENLSINEATPLQDHKSKRPVFHSNSRNRTIEIAGTLFPEDDIQSYLEGQRNLTSRQQEQIQAYLANQSSLDYNISSKYPETTNKPSRILTSDSSLLPEIETEESLSINEGTPLQDHKSKRPVFASKSVNRTIEIARTLFSEEDIQSYIEGRGNLSSKQEAQSSAYLANQSSSDYTIFSKYSKSTKEPNRTLTSDDSLLPQIEIENLSINESIHSRDHEPKRPLFGSKSPNRTIEIAGALFSEDDIQSYIEGRGNFSSKQRAQIQAYLANQSSSDYNIFSTYSQTTNKASRTITPDDSLSHNIQPQENLLMNGSIHSQDHKSNRPLFDSKSLNRTIEIAGTLFSKDDIESYLEGRANLTSNQQEQIRAYLANQSSSDYKIFSTDSQTTNKPGRTLTPDDSLLPDIQTEENLLINKSIHLQDHKPKGPVSDSKSLNRTIEIAGTLISEDEIQFYIEGRRNLTSIQQEQIQAYLANQSSSDYNMFSKYWKSTNKPNGLVGSNDSLLSEVQRDKDTSTNADIQSQDDKSKRPLYFTSFNRTTEIEGALFSEDEIQSYLEERENLTASQQAQISAYLANQSSSDYNIFSKYAISTNKPSRTLTSNDSLLPEIEIENLSINESINSPDHTSKRPLLDSQSVNRTIDIGGTIFSEDDIQSYLEERGNLTSSQQAQIQAYPANQSSSDYNVSSRYSTITNKPSRTSTSDHSFSPEIQTEENLLTNESIHSRDHASNRPLYDLKFLNRMIEIAGTLFSEDDIQSYIEGRGNLSSKQEAQIQAYLTNQSSSDYTISSKYSKSTKEPNRTLIPDDSLSPEIQTEENLLINESIHSQDHKSKRPLFDFKFLNRTIEIAATLFSEDDIQSYIEGRGNLSSKQEAQIQAYLTNQSLSDYNISSKYSKSTNKPSRTLTSDHSLSPETEIENLSINESINSPDHTSKRPLLDSQSVNRTIDIGGTIFSEDDIQSYLEERGNLTSSQQAQIQAYPANQSSSDYNVSSRYSTITNKPSRTSTSDHSLSPEIQTEENLLTNESIHSRDHASNRPLYDLKFLNRMIEIAGTLFSEDDIQSYIEGRGNLSSKQEAQIQAYLTNQSSSAYTISSKYSKSTKEPNRTLIPDDSLSPEIQTEENLLINESIHSQDHKSKRPLFDFKFLNRTIEIAATLFSEDDIQSYIEGRGNLSSKQEAQIQAYLTNQSLSDYNISSKYSKSTNKPSRTLTSDHSLSPETEIENLSINESINSRDHKSKRPLLDSQSLNRTIDIGGTLFSEDDIESYLEGRANLTSSQQEQIRAYLANQSSSDYSIFSTYSHTTNKPSETLTPDDSLSHEIQTEENLSMNGSIHSRDHTSNRPLYDLKSPNRTIEIAATLFSEDDIQSYIEGRGNLSSKQEAQIQAYLTNQSLSDYNISSKYSKSTNKPSRTLTSDHSLSPETEIENLSINESINSPDHTSKRPLLDSQSVNRTIDIGGTIFSEDDIQSYLEERGNLTSSQQAQIQAYPANQSSSDYNVSSRYSTITNKPSRTSTSDHSFSPEIQTEENLLTNESIHSRDHASNRPLYDLKFLNRMIEIAGTLFSEDDIQSYIEGRGNLSSKQEAQIQAYLTNQSSSDYTISSKYSKSTKEPNRTLIPDDSLSPEIQTEENLLINESIHSQDHKSKRPLFDFKFLNRTIEIAATLFSEDDIQSYIEGRGNLSSKQEAQIQAYLTNQSLSDYNISSKYSKSTNKPSRTLTSDHSLSPETEIENLSINESIYSRDHKSKRPLFDSKSLNRTIEIAGTLFSEDDIQSYIEGRGNFSSKQGAQIQAYLANQSSSDYNILSSQSTKKPKEMVVSKDTLPSDVQRDKDTSTKEDPQSQDYVAQRLVLDPKFFNASMNAEGTMVSEDEIESYLEGRGNFTSSQEVQIQAYLAKQLSSNHSLFSKYYTSTKKPIGISISDNNTQSAFQTQDNTSVTINIQSQDPISELPLTDSKSSNRTTDIAGTIFSEEEVQFYLQGRAKLSAIQETHKIQAYLAHKLSSTYNIFSKYSTSTKMPGATFISNDSIQTKFHINESLSLDENIQSEQLPNDSHLDHKYFNRTTDSLETTFTDEELQSYLQGRGNLSKSQETQIETYLAKQSSGDYNVFSKFLTTTRRSMHTSVSNDHVLSESDEEKNFSASHDSQSQSYATKNTSSDSKSLSRTIDMTDTIFSEEDVQSYLEERKNLTSSQEAEIQAYLAKQSSFEYTIFSRHSKSTKPATGILVSNDNIHTKPQDDNNSSQNNSTKRPSSDADLSSEHLDGITDSDGTLISKDELRSYLEGRSNLSASQETLIQAFLARKSSSYYNIFSKYSTSITKPSEIVLSNEKSLSNSSTNNTLQFDEDSQLQNYSKYFSRTTDTDEILFSGDDLKSYLEGRVNLSLLQETQIQAYLAKQSSHYYNIFSKYSTSTKKPRRSSRPRVTIQSELQREGNLSLIDDTQSEDYSEELLPSEPKYYNRTTDSEEILFSDDDLQSYLKGRANLSKSEEAKIQAYLTKLSSTNQTIFSRYSKATKLPTGIYASDDNMHPDYPSDDIQLQNYPTKRPLFDSQDFNFSTTSEEILFSADDLQSYLQGRANLSLAQETQIQAYLAKQTSSDNNTLLRYLTRTRKPANISASDDKLQIYSEGQTNLSSSDQVQSSTSPSHKFTSTKPYITRKRISGRRTSQSIINGSDVFDNSMKQLSDVYAHSTEDINISNDTLKEYPQISTTASLISRLRTDLSRKPFTRPSTDNRDNTGDTQGFFDLSNDGLNRFSESLDQLTQNISDTNLRTSTLSLNDSLLLKDHSPVTGFHPTLTDGSVTPHSDDYDQQKTVEDNDDKVNLPHFPVKFEPTNDPRFSQITPRQSLPTNLESLSLDRTAKPSLPYFLAADTDHTPPDSVVVLHDNITNLTSLLLETNSSYIPTVVDQTQISSPKIDDTMSYSIHQDIIPLQNQANSTNTSRLYDAVKDRLIDKFMNIKQTSTLSALMAHDTVSLITTFDHINNNIEDKTSHKHSSPLSVNIYVPSTLRPSALFAMFNTTLSSSRRSRLSLPLHRSLAPSSTKSPKPTRLSSSKLFSETTATISLSSEISSIDSKPPTTTVLSYSTRFPSFTSKLQTSYKSSSMQTTDAARTSKIPQEKSITTSFDMSSSTSFTTHHRPFESTITSTPLLTTNSQLLIRKSDQYTSKFSETLIETSSLPYMQSARIFTTLVPSSNLDSVPKIISDISSSRSPMTTTDEVNLALSDNHPFETTEILPVSSTLLSSLTDKYRQKLITTQSSLESASTSFPHYHKPKTFSSPEHTTFGRIRSSPKSTRPVRRRTTHPTTTSTITTATTTTTTTTTTTVRPYRTRKQKITPWQAQQLFTTITTSSTTTITPAYSTTSIYVHRITSTSTPTSIWHSQWNPLEQQEKIVIKPTSINNNSNTVLTNDFVNQILNNISTSTNSSLEKSIYLNLIDLPPSSWNLSLTSNESILLNIALPTPRYPSSSNTTTNLTFTNIEANRFSTNIIGIPIHFQVDRVETKKFSLTMNTTDANVNRNPQTQHLSDVIIGHVKSEQFELNLTKSDNMHVHIQQVDSATAELYLDSHFCTNESSLEINLNLSKNGTIRYGNRKPIHIGPVFTRVHMLKQSCHREQPLTLFFDICERQNPCSNGGTCLSVMPDYTDTSFTYTETGHVGYKCHCPLHTSGEHCQYVQYPLGYCLNGGTLLQISDRYNISVKKCICPLGFYGEHCEENIDNCRGIDCSHHGICEDGIETYKCLCFDGFSGFNCEKTNVQTVLLQVASRSFGIVAILLIALIAGLVVASDIHTYLTRKQQRNNLLNKIPRVTSELFENSVLLLGFSDAPIEMNDLTNVGTKKKLAALKQRQIKRTTRNRRPAGYRQLSRRRRPLTTFPKSSSSRRYFVSN